uniref:Uncharacterized protein n=1 Tax=Pristionchus pacificus TaxID=54126 RepID=A0A2A6BD40_PRIPA|eukprot:PDM63788.1 hypothetical protein PRIPAC_49761 [Pristionchus pacificus]
MERDTSIEIALPSRDVYEAVDRTRLQMINDGIRYNMSDVDGRVGDASISACQMDMAIAFSVNKEDEKSSGEGE